MKNLLLFCLFLLPFFAMAQYGGYSGSNAAVMKKMMTPQKIDFQKMVKREESRIEKLEKENSELNKDLEELKSEFAISDDSKKEKITKKITKLEEKITKNDQQIAASKFFVSSYKRE